MTHFYSACLGYHCKDRKPFSWRDKSLILLSFVDILHANTIFYDTMEVRKETLLRRQNNELIDGKHNLTIRVTFTQLGIVTMP